MTALRPLAALLAGGLILAGTAQVPAFAQTTVTRSKTVAPGKTVRLEIAPNLKKDCTPGPMPEFKVSGAPKNGSVITKVGKLKTPASYRCPNKEAAVQALFYQPNGGFTGFKARQAYSHNIAPWLQAAGYRTVHIGKFLNGYGDEPFDEGKDVPPGWNAWPTTWS